MGRIVGWTTGRAAGRRAAGSRGSVGGRLALVVDEGDVCLMIGEGVVGDAAGEGLGERLGGVWGGQARGRAKNRVGTFGWRACSDACESR